MASSSNGGFFADFKKFLSRGNVVDLAVAVIIGGAFGQIVNSLVTDILTPLILGPALEAAQVNDLQELAINGIKYGAFIAAILNFLVIALSLFMIIRAVEKANRRLERRKAVAEVEAPAPPDPAVVLQERTAAALERLSQALATRQM